MKKILTMAVFAFVVAMVATTSVSANTTIHFYEATVPHGQTGYLQYETASYNFVYSMNKLTSTAGRAAIHSYYQTKYNGSAVTVGGELVLDGAGYLGISLWKPTGVSSNPSGYSITNRKNCSGSNVTSNYCAIQGSQYRLKLDNENLLYHYKIKGQFIFTD